MIEEVIKKYSKYTPYINGWDAMQRAAVAILMVDIENETNIIFEVRALHMRSQPGDISFPGGKIENDESAEEAVKREVCEELGLNMNDFDIITPLDLLVTHYGLIIHPFLGYVKNYSSIKINKNEVDHIFLSSLDKLLKISPLQVLSKISVNRNKDFPYNLINGGENYKFKEGIYKSLFYNYGEYNIWGMTALILENFIKFINNKS
jgi:8-oxo-dGTP pyrophosphatase MutT (NUDIX family)